MPDISVIIPIFNEEGNIQPLNAALSGTLNRLGKSYEIIWINDGSTDASLEKLKGLPVPGPLGAIKIISLAAHSGKAAAMQAGFDNASGKVFVTMDGDLQNDPADIPALLSELDKGHDVVCGWRRDRHDTWLRRISSRAGNVFRKIFSGERIHDVGCMLRVYRADALKGIYLSGPYHRFLTWILARRGCKIAELPVTHHPRRHGEAKYNIRNRLPESLPVVFKLAFGGVEDVVRRRENPQIKEVVKIGD